MGRVGGIIDDPPGFPYTPPGVDVLEGGKLTSNQGSKLRPFWSHMLPKFNLCDSKIYLGAFVQVQIIAAVRPLQFSAKRSRITAQHVPRDRELTQVNLFIRSLV